jgi:hypothetical protein
MADEPRCCTYCGGPFTAPWQRQFCSNRCKGAHQSAAKEGQPHLCRNCGLSVRAAQKNGAIYYPSVCNRSQCRPARIHCEPKLCVICGERFERRVATHEQPAEAPSHFKKRQTCGKEACYGALMTEKNRQTAAKHFLDETEADIRGRIPLRPATHVAEAVEYRMMRKAYLAVWYRCCALRRLSLWLGIVGRETWSDRRCGPVLAYQICRVVHPWGERLPK